MVDMTLSFHTSLTAAHQCIAGHSALSLFSDITVIRDIHGKIRFLLEPEPATASTDINAVLQELTELARQSLGPYFSGDMWCSTSRRDGQHALVQSVQAERQPAPGSWTTAAGQPTWHVLERYVSKKSWTSRQAPSPPWSQTVVDGGHKPPVVTFYSFKGGSGRTTTLAGTALALARRGFRIGMIDMDLEAPGLSTLFFDQIEDQQGVLDYLLEKPIQQTGWSIHPHIQTVTDERLLGGSNGALHLLPTGSVDTHYLEKLARIDFQQLLEDRLETTLKTMLNEFERNLRPLDFMFIDARAGFHEIGGLTLSTLSHAAVLLGQYTQQTWQGLQHVIHRLANHDGPQTPVAMVHAMAPDLGTPNRNLEIRRFKERAYDCFLDHYYYEGEGPNMENPDAPHYPIPVPWNPALRGNVQLFRSGDTPEEASELTGVADQLTSAPYQEIADRLCRMFGRPLRQ